MKDNTSSYNSSVYDANITNVLPYYTEFHAQVIDVAKTVATLCDLSEGMLEIAKEKLSGKDIRFHTVASDALSYQSEFDLVTAIQSHHYYDIKTREIAVKKCYEALKEGGIFMAFENIRMSAEESDAIALKRWGRFLLDHGLTPEGVKAHQARRGTEMFPITIAEHLEILKNAGFTTVDILWVSYMQAGFWAVK